MQLIRNLVAVLTGTVLSALLAEAVLRTLPVTMGLYRTQSHESWPLNGYGPHLKFSYSMTWQMLHPNWGITNNYGQVSPFDYKTNSRPLTVVGDSFVEALMNRYEDTLQGELGRLLGTEIPVYSLGFSGNSLAEYLAVARQSKIEFAPRAMVFLIIDNDVRESWSNRLGHHHFLFGDDGIHEAYQHPGNPGPAQHIRHIFGDSALYRYVQVNIGFTVNGVIARRTSTPHPPVEKIYQAEDEARSRQVVDYFLKVLPQATGLPAERLILVFDSDRERLYNPSLPARRGVDSAEVQAYFQDSARTQGYGVVEGSKWFEQHYRRHGKRFDYTPVDRHWNGLGHKVAAAAVCLHIAGLAEPGIGTQVECPDPAQTK